MKNIKLILSLLILLSIVSCTKDEDNLGNLPGTWDFGSVFIDGMGSTASGIITFEEGNQSNMDLWFLIETDTIFLQGPFTFTETEATVDIILNNNTLIFNRSVNKRNEQEFEFTNKHDEVDYSVIFDMIPE